LKILVINEFTRTPGGIDNVVENTMLGLRKYPQIEVKVFGVSHNEFDILALSSKIKAFFKAQKGVYKYNELYSLIVSFKPDIIHIHNAYPLISQLIYHIHERFPKIPIIYHLHNFYPFCLNSYFYVNGNICTKCINKPNWKHGIVNKCYNNSRIQSLLVSTLRVSPVKWIEHSSMINTFLAVSNFVKQSYCRAGIPQDKITTIYNPVSLPDPRPKIKVDGEYALFIGRLTEAKGTELLFRLIIDNPDIHFKIVGDGPEKIRFENIIQTGRSNVELLGFIKGEAKDKIIQKSKIVIVPSQWWETFGLVIIEANSFGKKVVASNLGGITELINDGFNGFLCDAKDYNQFNLFVRKLYYESVDVKTQQKIQNHAYQYSLDNYTGQLVSMYKKVLSK
jgi:glycosyltransferase involved in cell wall biosynthesis